jgi:hypothetical protein
LALLAGGILAFSGAASALAPHAKAVSRVPRGFVGMNIGAPIFNPRVDLTGQMKKIASSGVQRLRVGISWATAQPYANCNDVPPAHADEFSGCPGGVPTNFTHTDRLMTVAARDHLQVTPAVTYAPSWDLEPGSHVQPARDRPYANYLALLVQRYGPQGTFWSEHPSLPRDPITSWQIWNEPDLSPTWTTQPFAPSYVALLKVAHAAIKRADPKAQVLLASLTNYGWRDLASIYKVHGSRGRFDGVTADVYTSHVKGVITILGYYRHVMSRYGDRHKPLIATEVGWPSDRAVANKHTPFSTTEKGQAKKLEQLLPLLAKNRHKLGLKSFFYYTWLTTDQGGPRTWYFYSGLLRFDRSTHKISPKPAYWSFRRTVRKLETGSGGAGSSHAGRQ